MAQVLWAVWVMSQLIQNLGKKQASKQAGKQAGKSGVREVQCFALPLAQITTEAAIADQKAKRQQTCLATRMTSVKSRVPETLL